MAPKKAEKKEDAKNPDGSKPADDKKTKDDAKENPDDAKPADKGKLKKLLEKIKDFFKSPMGMYISAVITIMILTLAIGSIIACLNEWNKTADLRYASRLVKSFMISRDPSYAQKHDVDTIRDADNIATGLADVAFKLNELEEEIAEIQYKLNHDWMAHKNALYTFNKAGRNLQDAINFCKSEKALMLKIESKEEMDFVETNVRSSFNTYWLGAYRISPKWIWAADNTEVKTFYWGENKPSMNNPSKSDPHCLTHVKYCGKPKNCWMDEPCSERRRVACKIQPLKKWMD